MRSFTSLDRLVTALVLALTASPAWACAVCGFGQDKSTGAFLEGTMLLSLMPFGLIGGTIFWIWRRAKNAAREASNVIPLELEES